VEIKKSDASSELLTLEHSWPDQVSCPVELEKRLED